MPKIASVFNYLQMTLVNSSLISGLARVLFSCLPPSRLFAPLRLPCAFASNSPLPPARRPPRHRAPAPAAILKPKRPGFPARPPSPCGGDPGFPARPPSPCRGILDYQRGHPPQAEWVVDFQRGHPPQADGTLLSCASTLPARKPQDFPARPRSPREKAKAFLRGHPPGTEIPINFLCVDPPDATFIHAQGPARRGGARPAAPLAER